MSDTVTKYKYTSALEEIGKLHMERKQMENDAKDYYSWYKASEKRLEEERDRNKQDTKLLGEALKTLGSCQQIFNQLAEAINNDMIKFDGEDPADAMQGITLTLSEINSILNAKSKN